MPAANCKNKKIQRTENQATMSLIA